ncbi:hypothetical protein HBH56_215070 [Parastagonospora nodorum]|uniref:Uncharacterized protein n=1 Tax=Phaeosphaeria nodorum (strain SN15 / ATCC MYA-4574 / FGSC 10173) TaxID=321614 RepID=A0A7U2EW10_PHANO|nr:hypothetical protein HBH56_215070 [Parastagonospora nodorum]QRC93816.1 hypothetical protein JI435_404560 [Parastagonospora nodorum SN15]KAH3922628.1 hypothetical protein HBH54_222430 [Parastagonospora nodorum]KAH3942184.1 hypothetical protein HBH53_192340 [Parastagonospora nodorum]KAH4018727.1 hypothetical protein HBI09_188950 [Parastagonospora nodorum]
MPSSYTSHVKESGMEWENVYSIVPLSSKPALCCIISRKRALASYAKHNLQKTMAPRRCASSQSYVYRCWYNRKKVGNGSIEKGHGVSKR